MAVGDYYSEAGGTRWICVGRPATEDQVGWAALTWTQIKGVLSIPDRGDTQQDAGEMTLDDARKIYLPGSKDGGRLAIPFLFIEGDAGQALLFTNAGTQATVSWQEKDVDGKATFWHGKIMGLRRRASNPNANKSYIVDFGVNSPRFIGIPDNT
jgi:hypothetical protein